MIDTQSVRGEIKALPIGGSTTIAASRIKEGVVRNYASVLSFEMSGKFSVKRDNKTRSFIVTREY